MVSALPLFSGGVDLLVDLAHCPASGLAHLTIRLAQQIRKRLERLHDDLEEVNRKPLATDDRLTLQQKRLRDALEAWHKSKLKMVSPFSSSAERPQPSDVLWAKDLLIQYGPLRERMNDIALLTDPADLERRLDDFIKDLSRAAGEPRARLRRTQP